MLIALDGRLSTPEQSYMVLRSGRRILWEQTYNLEVRRSGVEPQATRNARLLNYSSARSSSVCGIVSPSAFGGLQALSLPRTESVAQWEDLQPLVPPKFA
jgi:hypothetical protein